MPGYPEDSTEYHFLPPMPRRWRETFFLRWRNYNAGYKALALQTFGVQDPVGDAEEYSLEAIEDLADDIPSDREDPNIHPPWVDYYELGAEITAREYLPVDSPLPFDNLDNWVKSEILVSAWVINTMHLIELGEQVKRLLFFGRRGRPSEPEE